MSDIHIHGVVTRDGTREPIENAVVELLKDDVCIASTRTDESGQFSLKESLVESGYKLRAKAFGVSSEPPTPLDVPGEQHQYDAPVNIDVKLDLRLAFSDHQRGAGTRTPNSLCGGRTGSCFDRRVLRENSRLSLARRSGHASHPT